MTMNNYALAIHGGASEETSLLKENFSEYERILALILEVGRDFLSQGGRAVDAVEKVVQALEDHPLFNAGRGSVLNNRGEVEMDASIMDGLTLKAGAVSIIKEVKNPISLAKAIMENTNHVMLSGEGAMEAAKAFAISLENPEYFVTDYQKQVFLKTKEMESPNQVLKKKIKGTVGAVALDKEGNIAAATSTGGTSNSLPGRVGDSCIIGAGCYAHNNTCAVSGTGEGEVLITNVVAHTIAMLVECYKWPLQQACDYVIKKRRGQIGEMGIISLDRKGKFGISFNTEIMKRAWLGFDGNPYIKIY